MYVYTYRNKLLNSFLKIILLLFCKYKKGSVNLRESEEGCSNLTCVHYSQSRYPPVVSDVRTQVQKPEWQEEPLTLLLCARLNLLDINLHFQRHRIP